jgi:hypothetical protein
MKKASTYILLSVIAIMIWGCDADRVVMGSMPDKHKPYIQLKNGRTIEGKEVSGGTFKIAVNETKFRKSDVSFYGDGYEKFANVGGLRFATLSDVGDLNVYKRAAIRLQPLDLIGAGWMNHTRSKIEYFFQKGETGHVQPLTDRNLKSYILPSEPANYYLERFRVNRVKDVSLVGLGYLASAGGVVMLLAGPSNDISVTRSIFLCYSGLSAILVGEITAKLNKINLRRAIAKHNGVYVIN